MTRIATAVVCNASWCFAKENEGSSLSCSVLLVRITRPGDSPCGIPFVLRFFEIGYRNETLARNCPSRGRSEAETSVRKIMRSEDGQG